jgi:hypothetical protein
MGRNLREVNFISVLFSESPHMMAVNRIHCRGTTYDVDLVVGMAMIMIFIKNLLGNF